MNTEPFTNEPFDNERAVRFENETEKEFDTWLESLRS